MSGVDGAVGDVTVTICPDGPLLVRGPALLRTVDGRSVDHDRTVLALCRCGRSRLKPLCDGSHKLSKFRDPATADQLDHVLTHATPLSDGSAGSAD
ncbi:MAG: CDGSH iron-sulfur domain-containing protein [Janthinobacterium lividum]